MSDKHKCQQPGCDQKATWRICYGKQSMAYACELHMVESVESAPGVLLLRLEVEETKEGLR